MLVWMGLEGEGEGTLLDGLVSLFTELVAIHGSGRAGIASEWIWL
jgi:hypothetical protein